MTTTIARDNFIQSVVTSLKRELYIETEDHVRFPSYDPLILLHVWREGEEYASGFSERLSGPSTEIWANSLTPIKQWLVMYNFDLLRWHLGLERFGIRFRNLLVAPHWSHRPGTTEYSVELCHNDEPTGIYAGKNSPEATTLTWFLNHSPEQLLEIAHIESTKEACQALFGMPRIPFAKPTDTRQ